MAGPFTVLFVEDEHAMRELVRDILSQKGFVVLTAADGDEALRLLTGRHIDLLLTDIVMPGMDGFQLATQAKLIRPHLKVLYTSGYAQKAAGRDELQHGKLLPKPLRPAALVWEINALLTGAA